MEKVTKYIKVARIFFLGDSIGCRYFFNL